MHLIHCFRPARAWVTFQWNIQIPDTSYHCFAAKGRALYLKPIMAASGLCVGIPTHHYYNYSRQLSADPTLKQTHLW